jgi:hypothetical protein
LFLVHSMASSPVPIRPPLRRILYRPACSCYPHRPLQAQKKDLCHPAQILMLPIYHRSVCNSMQYFRLAILGQKVGSGTSGTSGTRFS